MGWEVGEGLGVAVVSAGGVAEGEGVKVGEGRLDSEGIGVAVLVGKASLVGEGVDVGEVGGLVDVVHTAVRVAAHNNRISTSLLTPMLAPPISKIDYTLQK